MLLCFAAAWPLSILKSWRSRDNQGKSIGFLLTILIGYLAGIAKVLFSEGWAAFLLIPYSLNFCLVGIDTVIYFRNQKLTLAGTAENGTERKNK